MIRLVSLALLTSLVVASGGSTAGASAGGVPPEPAIPLGTALWFACTQPHYAGPTELACQRQFDPRYTETFLQGFERFTPENEFKMTFLEPSQGRFEFSLADQVAAFARANGKTVRGHTLVWGNATPGWLEHPLLPWNMRSLGRVLEDYVTTVVSHFAQGFPGTVTEWDVVNEPLDPVGGLAPSAWLRGLGPDYIPTALTLAHRADPSARLVINEKDAEIPGPKAEALLSLATRLRLARVPLDAIGFQAHVSPITAPSLGDLVTLWKRYRDAGLAVEVTELDVRNDTPATTAAAKLDVLRRFALACRLSPNCTGLTVWGVADAYSWIGSGQDPLLYDRAFRPKPVALEIRRLLSARRPAPIGTRRRNRPASRARALGSGATVCAHTNLKPARGSPRCPVPAAGGSAPR